MQHFIGLVTRFVGSRGHPVSFQLLVCGGVLEGPQLVLIQVGLKPSMRCFPLKQQWTAVVKLRHVTPGRGGDDAHGGHDRAAFFICQV